MQKQILVIMLALFSSISYAGKIIDYSCSSPDASYINKIIIRGEIDVDTTDGEFTNSPIYIKMIPAGYDAESDVFFGTISGKRTYYAPGEMAFNDIIHISSVVNSDNIKSVSLLFGHPDPLSSKITTMDGVTYRGKCTFNLW